MFCTACGEAAKGKFCWNCGAEISGGEPAMASEPPADWSDEHRYDVLVKIPEVRDRISKHSSKALKAITAEEFLQLGEKALSSLTGGVPLSKVANLVQPIYASWGVGTGKVRSARLSAPIGKTTVAVLCSLAKAGQDVKSVQTGVDGCVITALLPSDLFAFAGDLVVTIQRDGQGTKVDAATRIKGQYFDWGKSRRALNQLFRDLENI